MVCAWCIHGHVALTADCAYESGEMAVSTEAQGHETALHQQHLKYPGSEREEERALKRRMREQGLEDEMLASLVTTCVPVCVRV